MNMNKQAYEIYAGIKNNFTAKYTKRKDNESIYYTCVKQAYKDLMFRTLKGHTSKYRETNLKQISGILEKYHDQPTIDLIHKVFKVFEKEFDDCNLDKTQLFGKSQKVVNMAFKYLCCFNVEMDYSKCHIPLDSRIIDYYVERRKMYDHESLSYVPTWSHITEQEYLKIQDKLQEYYLKDGLDLKPLEAEYIIWAYATIKLNIKYLDKFSKEELEAYYFLKI